MTSPPTTTSKDQPMNVRNAHSTNSAPEQWNTTCYRDLIAKAVANRDLDTVLAVRDGEMNRLRNRVAALESAGAELLRRVTTDQLQARLTTSPCGYIYDGILIIELGDDADRVVTIGHVDKAAFGRAYDTYLNEVCGPDRLDLGFTIEEFAAEAWHAVAYIRPLDEFPHGEFEIVLDKAGDVNVTVRDN